MILNFPGFRNSVLKIHYPYEARNLMLQQYPLIAKLTIWLLFVILLVFALVEGRDFLYPLAIAVLFAYLLYPLVKFMEGMGLPRIMANLLSIISGIIAIGALLYFLYSQSSIFMGDLPALKEQAIQNIEDIDRAIRNKLGLSSLPEEGLIHERLSGIFETSSDFFKKAFTSTAETIAKVALLPVYVFFLLYYRNKFTFFLLKLVAPEKHPKMLDILKDVSYVTKKYMGGIFIVVVILCFLNSIGLFIIGVKYALLLGIISALFNFIPYFGTLIGGLVPLLFTLFMSETPEKAFGVILLFLIIQFLENNILTPNIVGGNVRLNPFITILAIIVGGMVWGIPGMFISVPFLGMFKIVCENISFLKPYSYLLGAEGTEQHAFTFHKARVFFSKLSGKKQ